MKQIFNGYGANKTRNQVIALRDMFIKDIESLKSLMTDILNSDMSANDMSEMVRRATSEISALKLVISNIDADLKD